MYFYFLFSVFNIECKYKTFIITKYQKLGRRRGSGGLEGIHIHPIPTHRASRTAPAIFCAQLKGDASEAFALYIYVCVCVRVCVCLYMQI